MATSGGIQNFGALLSNSEQLEVPDFQRNYAWVADNVDSLHDDIMIAMDSEKDHFMGSTILMAKPDVADKRHYLVVDGQQRLTTLFMYLAVLRDKVVELENHVLPAQSSEGNPVNVLSNIQDLIFSDVTKGTQRFVANSLNRQMFKMQILHYPHPTRAGLPKKHFSYSLQLRKAYWKIQSLIDTEISKRSAKTDALTLIAGVTRTIRERLQLLAINTDSFDESLDIFMTLNSRGLALGPSDLVKSEIFKNLTQGLADDAVETASGQLTSEWKKITDVLNDLDVDQFLRHYLVSMQPDSVTSKVVFTKVKKLLAEHDSRSLKKASQWLLDSLINQSELYAMAAQASHSDEKINASLRVMSHVLDSYRILLMAVVDPAIGLHPSERREIARLAEVLSLRWVISGGNAQQLEDIFQRASVELRNPEFDLAKVKDELTKSLPKDEKVKTEFFDVVTSQTLVRVVLHRLNGVLGDPENLIAYNSKKIHVEHIAPASSTDHWRSVLFPDHTIGNLEVEYDSLVEQWGNKTILEKSINQKVAQKPFAEKRDGDPENAWPGYGNSVLATTQDLKNVPDWSRDVVVLRNEWLGDVFCKVWAVDDLSGQVISFSEWLATRSGS
jgi:hypothetical protein